MSFVLNVLMDKFAPVFKRKMRILEIFSSDIFGEEGLRNTMMFKIGVIFLPRFELIFLLRSNAVASSCSKSLHLCQSESLFKFKKMEKLYASANV